MNEERQTGTRVAPRSQFLRHHGAGTCPLSLRRREQHVGRRNDGAELDSGHTGQQRNFDRDHRHHGRHRNHEHLSANGEYRGRYDQLDAAD